MTVDPGAPPPPPEELTLAAAFPAATREQWEKLVVGVLDKSGARGLLPAGRGRAAQRDGRRHPDRRDLRAEDVAAAGVPDPGFPGSAPFVRGRRPEGTLGGWDVRALFDHPDPGQAREQVLTDLENGVTSIWLRVGDSGFADLRAAATCSRTCCSTSPRSSSMPAPTASPPPARSSRSPRSAGSRVASLSGNLGLDPVGYAARTGEPDRAQRDGRVRRRAREVGRRSAALDRRRRAGVPRRGRLRGAGARRLARRRGHVSARARRGRAVAGAGLRAARVPLRRDRRPVPHHRQAAGGPPAVGARRREPAVRRPASRVSCSTRSRRGR